MATEILMPALSPTMEEGTLAKWLVAEGDTVASGDILAEIETDKAIMEFEAVDDGIIGKILIPEGSEAVKVNTPIAIILEDGESADSVSAPPPTPSPDTTPAAPAPARAHVPGPQPQPAAPLAVSAPDEPDLPPGTQMRSTTVREALRDAMSEEMRADPTG